MKNAQFRQSLREMRIKNNEMAVHTINWLELRSHTMSSAGM